MKITLNGKACQCKEPATVQAVIEQEDLTGKRIAVEVNMELVPRSQFVTHLLQEGDRVEIVHAIGGG